MQPGAGENKLAPCSKQQQKIPTAHKPQNKSKQNRKNGTFEGENDRLGQVGNSEQWDKRKTILSGVTNGGFICQNTIQT